MRYADTVVRYAGTVKKTLDQEYPKNILKYKTKNSTKSFSLNLRERIVKTVIWSTLLHVYGAESLTLRKDDIQRLESCERWLWRKTLTIFWSDKVSNDEVLWCVDVEKSV